MNVREIRELRGRLRQAGAEYKVVKNTLLDRAAESLGITGLEPYLQGPTAVAFGLDDPVGPAKILQDYIRQMRKLEVKGGLIEGRILSADQVRALADLPSKSQMLATVLGALKAPMQGLASVLGGVQRNLLNALVQIQRQKEAA